MALLLDYPPEAWIAHLDAIADVVAPLHDATHRDATPLPALLDHLRNDDIYTLQEQYVETFDRGASTSLNLFEHVHGEARERGQAMVDLLTQYRASGLELGSHQLPDYLPVYLEYCSMLPPEAGRAALGDIAPLLANLTDALVRRGSPWNAVTATLCRMAGLQHWPDVVRAEQARAQAQRTPTPGPRDVRREGPPEDWSPAALDAAWAEEAVTFLGAPDPRHAPGVEQPVQFVRRDARPRSQGG